MFKNNFYSYVGGTRSDIAMSIESYFEVMEVLLDQYLSREMLFNFKNCSQVLNDIVVSAPLAFLPFSLIGTQWLFAGANRKGANKAYGPILASVHMLVLWKAYTAPIPNKLFTKIIADPTVDGQYIRTQLSVMKPGLWQVLSRELYHKGYRYPEMLEFKTATEFPTGFVKPY
ncbi:unnamed protein product (macronuclear) [Paramecium tetraurelia]|uniref:Uncharacterized protein n=1 Tax=Paramecium tetraurelia TaxID=5888 RepID=A0CDL6_PARTE|nr:uncharacterized protein GSPATT00007094001 [Paramecium tetraurelia]CAK68883.1 unnamed protein product [Paramecium tetraurelia]|eukprot:XP_001436280.1 hypothetical protein (macronuclear) [Paramecium tetraurelia strain d4-2]